MLSAYHFTHDETYLYQADQLGMALMPAFNTTSGLPSYAVIPSQAMRNGGWQGMGIYGFAESASCQMVSRANLSDALALLTGDLKRSGVQIPRLSHGTARVLRSCKQIACCICVRMSFVVAS